MSYSHLDWDALASLSGLGRRRGDVRCGESRDKTGKCDAALDHLWAQVRPKIEGSHCLYERSKNNLDPDSNNRLLFWSLFRMNRINPDIAQAPSVLGLDKYQFETKFKLMAMRVSQVIDYLDPSIRFDTDNHVPFLPANYTFIVDSAPVPVWGSLWSNPKYGSTPVMKMSFLSTLKGDVFNYQGLFHGLAHDPKLMRQHSESVQQENWERGLGDMAYEEVAYITTQHVKRRPLTAAEIAADLVVGHIRARIEAVIGEIKNNKGLFEKPWKGDFELLDALVNIEVHASQCHRDCVLGTRYFRHSIGEWPHFNEFY